MQSENFDFYAYNAQTNIFKTSLFKDNENNSDFNLSVYFPNLRNQLLSSSSSFFDIEAIILSIVFTLIIVMVYISTISQLLKQKQIAQIKSDFINNMTHEFKTPIATINLALDAISSSTKNLNDKSISYLGMIREENSRMLSQVENILRISQLEKSSNPFDMEEIDIHEVIEDAIEHVKLIVESKKGSIDLSLKAVDSNISGNSNHLENIIINILDNAVKYSKENPKIVVSSTNINKDIRLCFEDNGIGMDKNTQKLIFEKFYREQNGDIHNIKGHGLGLSYVKKIIDFHNGKILLESKKGTGTKFYITLKNI